MRYSFSILLTFGLLTFTQVASAGLEEGVVVYFSFGGKNGTVQDVSKNGNDGTVEEGKWTDGKDGGGMEFIAAEQRVEIPPCECLDLTTAISITAWVKANYDSAPGPGKYCDIITASDMEFAKGPDRGWGVESVNFAYQPNGQLHTNTRHSNAWAASMNVAVPYKQGEWHHVALVLDASKKSRTTFFDGKQIGADNNCNNPVDLRWFVGNGCNGDEFFNGAIDEVFMFNRTLTEQEVADVQNGKLSQIFQSVSKHGKLAITWGAIKF